MSRSPCPKVSVPASSRTPMLAQACSRHWTKHTCASVSMAPSNLWDTRLATEPLRDAGRVDQALHPKLLLPQFLLKPALLDPAPPHRVERAVVGASQIHRQDQRGGRRRSPGQSRIENPCMHQPVHCPSLPRGPAHLAGRRRRVPTFTSSLSFRTSAFSFTISGYRAPLPSCVAAIFQRLSSC
jgi:hypothetical protein